MGSFIKLSIRELRDDIVPSHIFRETVAYERTRADRLGSVFSVVVLDIVDLDRDYLQILVDHILQKKRSVDCVGWDVKGSIAFLLPDTYKDGAIAFCRKLNEVLSNENIGYDVYTYPENWLTNSQAQVPVLQMSEGSIDGKKNIEGLFVRKLPVWKRTIDIVIASFLLLLTAPLFLLLALYIKLVSPGPVFFHQTRIGYRGLPFLFWKFRTMNVNSDQSIHGKQLQSFIKNGDIPMTKLDQSDHRIYIGGHILRVSCIDELPQLWNVLKGDMSLVGPRPCIPYEAQDYLRWHTHRFDTVPGMTGLWQVSGKEKLTFQQMIRLDIAYSKKLSFWKDLYIVLKTPYVIAKMIISPFSKKSGKQDDDESLGLVQDIFQ